MAQGLLGARTLCVAFQRVFLAAPIPVLEALLEACARGGVGG